MDPTSSEIHLEGNLKLYIFLFEFMHHRCIETNAVVVNEISRIGLSWWSWFQKLYYKSGLLYQNTNYKITYEPLNRNDLAVVELIKRDHEYSYVFLYDISANASQIRKMRWIHFQCFHSTRI